MRYALAGLSKIKSVSSAAGSLDMTDQKSSQSSDVKLKLAYTVYWLSVVSIWILIIQPWTWDIGLMATFVLDTLPSLVGKAIGFIESWSVRTYAVVLAYLSFFVSLGYLIYRERTPF